MVIPLVYILDDHPLIYQNLVESTLQQYDVLLFSEVSSFYAALKDRLPDAILLDIGLNHVLTGMEILQHLKDSHKTGLIPIMIITGQDIDFLTINPLQHGAIEIIFKPVKTYLLVALINKYTSNLINSKRIAVTSQANSIDLNCALFIENFDNLLERPDIFHLNISDVAKLMKISISTFERLIKKVYGQTPVKYFTELKLAKAEILVMSNQYSIIKIAEILGFSSDSHFINCFKKKFKASPRSYYTKKVL